MTTKPAPELTPAQIPFADACRDVLQVSKPIGYKLIRTKKLKTHLVGKRRYTTLQNCADCVEVLALEPAPIGPDPRTRAER
jgi:hypothetical protein